MSEEKIEGFMPYPRPTCGEKIVEILRLIIKIIELILAGMKAIDATKQVAKENGVSFLSLWTNLPEKYK